MDPAAIFGLLIGVLAVVLGNMLDGGKTAAILQATAAVIVFGGTLGATMLSYPASYLGKAAASIGRAFSGKRPDSRETISELVMFAARVRRTGLLSMEPELGNITEPFLRRGLRLAMDGISPAVLRETMEQELRSYEDDSRRTSRVFETAGGYAPTIGILGAVLGLIEVMRNLADPSKLGLGIAVAFVSTLYGVGVANLVLLPMHRKLLNILELEVSHREMIIEGVLGIQGGMNPRYLEDRLMAHVPKEETGF